MVACAVERSSLAEVEKCVCSASHVMASHSEVDISVVVVMRTAAFPPHEDNAGSSEDERVLAYLLVALQKVQGVANGYY